MLRYPPLDLGRFMMNKNPLRHQFQKSLWQLLNGRIFYAAGANWAG
jgi:hypothetical protein